MPASPFSILTAKPTVTVIDKDEKCEGDHRCLSWQKEAKGLTFVKTDVKTLRIIAFTDSSFANNKDLSSQIGYVIVLADAQNNANIIHWQSIKCRRVTRSVLASELYALSLGFDVAATIKSTLDQMFFSTAQAIPFTVCIDSRSLYECLVKLGTTQEKRLRWTSNALGSHVSDERSPRFYESKETRNSPMR